MTSQYPQVTTRPLARPAATMSPAVDRRARLILRRLDPWSVLKFSVVVYSCLIIISLLIFAVIWSVVTVLLTLLFNLVNDVTGGIEVVLAEREHRPGDR